MVAKRFLKTKIPPVDQQQQKVQPQLIVMAVCLDAPAMGHVQVRQADRLMTYHTTKVVEET